jgi:hypothetical protein
MWVSHTEGNTTTTVSVTPNRNMFCSLIAFFGGLWLVWHFAQSVNYSAIVVGVLLAAFGVAGIVWARRLIHRANRAYDAAYRK